jgi:hypothetical protein
MSQQAMRQAARTSALEGKRPCAQNGPTGNAASKLLALAVLTALGERDAFVRDA